MIERGRRPQKGGNIRGENEQRNTRRGGGEKTKWGNEKTVYPPSSRTTVLHLPH